MNYIIHSLLVILTVATFELIAEGQSRNWHVYSSTDDRFTVEIPPSGRMVKTSESKNEADLGPDQRENLDSYVSVYEDVSSDQPSKFRIVVINGRAGIFKSVSRSELLTYLSVMVIGDDDDPRPTSDRAIKVNRLDGREYVWSKEDKVFEYGSSQGIFTRGRIFDQGDKIYIIVFTGENAAELKSSTAEHFLNSLNLHKRKR